MKKVILLMVMFFAVINAKTLTKSEKQEMLRQFLVFQKALESKDGNTLKEMIKFPLMLVEYGRDYEEPMKESDFLDEADIVAEELKGIAYLKVNTEDNSLSDYLEKGHACSIKYTGNFKENELYITAKFVPGEIDACSGYTVYKFRMYKNKLKLYDIYLND